MNNKQISFILLIMAIMAEYFHLLFEGIVHSQYVRNDELRNIYWDDVIYHFLNESFTLIIIIIVRIKAGTTRATKAMLTGLVTWFFIEWIEMLLYLFKISDARLFVNDGSWLQLSTCLTIYILVLFGNKKL